jgi:hypothetical protein
MIRDILHVASPSMRPPWSKPQHKPLHRDEISILLLAARADRPLRYRDVVHVLGGEPWSRLNSLKMQGGLDHLGYDRWVITEKGRIAAALAMHKDWRDR